MIDYDELVIALRKMLEARGNGWHKEDGDENSWIQDGTRNGLLIDDVNLYPPEIIINTKDFSGSINESFYLKWLGDFDAFVKIGAFKPRTVYYTGLDDSTKVILNNNGVVPAHNTTESIVELVSKTFDLYYK